MKETLPSYEAMMSVVLKVLADGVSRSLRKVFELVCQHYAFTPQQLAEMSPSGRHSASYIRVSLAKTYLVKAGLIEQSKRGICLITERGKAALASGQPIDNRYLAQFGEFLAFTSSESTDGNDPGTSKSLAQQRFEAWLQLGRSAQKKFAKDVVDKVALVLRGQLDALDDRSISVQERWKEKARLSDPKLLRQFSPATQQALHDMASLMQWLDVRDQGDAIRFDLDMIAAQQALYDNPGQLMQSYHKVAEKVELLPPHLAQVQQHGELINQLRERLWWQQADFEQLEHARLTLRSIMHLMEPRMEEHLALKRHEEWVQKLAQKRYRELVQEEVNLYGKKVQEVLNPLVNSNPVLQKIRRGQPVADHELDELRKLVLVQNPNVDIEVLTDFYPEVGVGLDKLLRTLVGMDGEAVAERFTAFAAENCLSAVQMRFLNLLKNHIRTFGTIKFMQLFEQPFTSVNSQGVTGVFPDMAQVMALATIVDGFTVDTGKPHFRQRPCSVFFEMLLEECL